MAAAGRAATRVDCCLAAAPRALLLRTLGLTLAIKQRRHPSLPWRRAHPCSADKGGQQQEVNPLPLASCLRTTHTPSLSARRLWRAERGLPRHPPNPACPKQPAPLLPRMQNDLRPDLRKEPWDGVEEYKLARAHSQCGNQWAEIARFLPGRSENTIKNKWWVVGPCVGGGVRAGGFGSPCLPIPLPGGLLRGVGAADKAAFA